jgi:hypothetical protein
VVGGENELDMGSPDGSSYPPLPQVIPERGRKEILRRGK